MAGSGRQKTTAFIPARCGSKSIPLKNIKPFLGRPLIDWTLNALQKSDSIDEIIVSTDCDAIEELVKELNYSKVQVFNRSESNATDEASTESAMLEYIKQSDMVDEEIFVLVQATSPWTRSKDINEALSIFSQTDCDSLLSVVQSHSFYWNSKGESVNYDYNNRPRRQEFESQYQENGAFYINSVGNIKSNANRLSGKIAFYPMHKFSSVEIDDESDWQIAETLMSKRLKELNSKI